MQRQQERKKADRESLERLRNDVDLLLEAHNELVESCNANAHSYAQVFQHIDVRLGAVQYAVDDLIADLLKLAPYSPLIAGVDGQNPVLRLNGSGVSWEHYIRLRLERIKEELAATREGAKLQPAPVVQDAEAPASMDVIFGGSDEVPAVAAS